MNPNNFNNLGSSFDPQTLQLNDYQEDQALGDHAIIDVDGMLEQKNRPE